MPNVYEWRPGDLILVSNLKPNFFSKQVINNQSRGGYSGPDSRWHHAAVHLGKGNICEAGLRGVRSSTVYPYVGEYLLRVRRDPSLSIETQFEISQYALLALSAPYSFFEILRLAVKARNGFWNRDHRPSQIPGARATICSQLYAEAYMKATQKVLRGSAGEITPAFLSHTPHLQDVRVAWNKVGE